MNTPTTHEDAREALGALALDALDGAEHEAVIAHVRECEACARELAELRETAAALVEAVPAARLDDTRRAGVRSRLLARAAADRPAVEPPRMERIVGVEPRPEAAPAAPAPAPRPAVDFAAERARRRGVPAWMAIAASLVAIAAGAWALRTAGERDALRGQLAQARVERDSGVASARALSVALAGRDSALQALGAGDVVTMRMTTTGEARRGPRGRMYWARATDAWVFVANDLPRPPAGRTYQLWLVTGDQKISAGTFAPDSGGTVLVRATYRLTPEQLKAIAVTVEPEGGVPEPTGPMVLVTSAE